jgi:transcriptional regulator with XRE-family HTH domain
MKAAYGSAVMSTTETAVDPQVELAVVEVLKGVTFTVRPDGERLRRLRGMLRQREVEEACGLGLNQLTRFENGLPVNLHVLAALANYYGVSPASLLDEDVLQQLLAKVGAVFQMFGEQALAIERPARPRQTLLQLS